MLLILQSVFPSLFQSLNKALQSVMGKSNLRFAGMSIAVNISVDGLGLLIPTTRQVRCSVTSSDDMMVFSLLRQRRSFHPDKIVMLGFTFYYLSFEWCGTKFTPLSNGQCFCPSCHFFQLLCLSSILFLFPGDSTPSHAVHLFCFWGRHCECSTNSALFCFLLAMVVVVIALVVVWEYILAGSVYQMELSFTALQINEGFNLVIWLPKLICFCPLHLHSCLLQDTPDYVAYVAKDPVNQRGNPLSSPTLLCLRPGLRLRVNLYLAPKHCLF